MDNECFLYAKNEGGKFYNSHYMSIIIFIIKKGATN